MLAVIIIIVEIIIIHNLGKENAELKGKVEEYEQIIGMSDLNDTVSPQDEKISHGDQRKDTSDNFSFTAEEAAGLLSDDAENEKFIAVPQFVSETVKETDDDTSTSVYEEKLRPVQSVSGLFKTGVSMVLIAGLVFVTTNWAVMSSGLKIFIIMLVTALFFGVSAIAEKSLRLESTAKAFFTLGSMFIPVTVISMFFFEIFGEWFSFSGEGRYLALMAVFLSCSAGAAVITAKYDTDYSAYISMFSVSAAVFMLAVASESTVAVLLISAVFSYAVYLLKEDILEQLGLPSAYLRNYHRYSLVNFIILSVSAFFYAASGGNKTDILLGMIFLIAASVFFQIRTDKKEIRTLCRILTSVFWAGAVTIVHLMFHDAGMNEMKMLAATVCMFVPLVSAYTFFRSFRSGAAVVTAGISLLLFVPECSMAQYGTAAFIIMIIGTGIFHFTSDSRNVSSVCRALYAAEYIFLCVFICASVPDEVLAGNKEITAFMYVPAFALFTFAPKFRSHISAMIMTSAQFTVIQLIMENNTVAASVVLMSFVVITALRENSIIRAMIYSSVFPVTLFRVADELAVHTETAEYITIAITAAAALLTVVLSSRSDNKRYLSVPLVMWTVLVTPAAALINFDSAGFSTVLTVTCAILVTVSYILIKNEKRVFAAVTASAASFDLQMFLMLALIRCFDGSDASYQIWIPAFITEAVLAVSGMYISRRNRFAGKVLAYTSCFSVLLSLAYEVPYPESRWVFGFLMMFVFYFISAGFSENHPYLSGAEYSAAAFLSGVALASQRFVSISDSILPEYLMISMALPYIFLFRIWKDRRDIVEKIFFVNAAADIMILMTFAFDDNLVHSISLGIVCVVMILRAAAVHSRKWMILGSVSLFILVMYVTRGFWLSIAWWVYLMTAGMLLIVCAAYSEYCRKTGQENMIVNKVKSVFKHSVQ